MYPQTCIKLLLQLPFLRLLLIFFEDNNGFDIGWKHIPLVRRENEFSPGFCHKVEFLFYLVDLAC